MQATRQTLKGLDARDRYRAGANLVDVGPPEKVHRRGLISQQLQIDSAAALGVDGRKTSCVHYGLTHIVMHDCFKGYFDSTGCHLALLHCVKRGQAC